ncbi:AMP-dependent synthetase/ligase [Halorussus ruber]|uniref:AMP-dependent synthetase/ligase n=1 Tax=Halorussus ruber TaxID=1126238 RepID=UPI0010924419|nr:long-chain fatty acid--CoA ligase [Halorussus ruber]
MSESARRDATTGDERDEDVATAEESDAGTTADKRTADETTAVEKQTMDEWFTGVADEYADRTLALVRRDAGDEVAFEERTFGDHYERAAEVASALSSSGVEPGDRVGIRADTCYEWSVVDVAAYLAGVVLVPVFPDFSPDQATYVVEDAGIDALFVEDDPARQVADAVDAVYRLDDLPRGNPDDLPDLNAAPDDVATIIYTSGTTGDPKGCAITHRNLLAGTEMIATRLPVEASDVGTCFLPLSHVFQRVGTYLFWDAGASAAYMHPDDIKSELRAVEPSVLITVPRVYRRIYDRLQNRIAGMSGAKRRLLDWADGVAHEYGEELSGGGTPGPLLRVKHALADRLVFSKLRSELGLTNVRHAITGAASIDADLLHFFWGMGVPLCEVYGATETTGPVASNYPDHFRAGTVGQPIGDGEVRLADDGEILYRGPNVMDRYWGDEQATAESLTDGWYHTGDIGEFDDEEFLQIVDRKKRIAVLDTGKTVAPTRIESVLTRSRYIGDAMAVADGRKFVTALVQPNFEALADFADEQGLDADPTRDDEGTPVAVSEDLLQDGAVRNLYEEEIEEANESLAESETVGDFRLISREFSVEKGELTPTLKKRQSEIEERFAEKIGAMYEGT